ncbi:MAG: 50S ribosomal protein L29 [Chloroflexi bacterium]|jgi:large subunit ribosomal protein L29|nr:50S ribosomal protein L29 [Chloroflexota bacterium]
MNAKEIKELSIEEIKAKLMNTRQELMNLRFQMVTGQLTDTSRFKIARRDIARLETALNQRARNEKEGK